MTAIRKLKAMTVAEFQDWIPDAKADLRWNLIDGIPVCMAPASSDHARIAAQLTFLLKSHLNANMPGCDALIAPGVVPEIDSVRNERVPDIGVTCEPPSDSRTIAAPILLIEILSPSNSRVTRKNVEAYRTIASMREVLLLGSQSITAEVTSRMPNGAWPPRPTKLGLDDDLVLSSIGFRVPLVSLYATTSLAAKRRA